MMHRIGAVLFVIWGLIHINAAYLTYKLGQGLEAGIVQGRVFQNAGFLLFFAIVAIAVAVKMNWHNSRLGYWLNTITLTVTDVIYIVFLIIPGYVPLWPGLIGPLFWVLALVFSTMAILKEKQ